MAKQATELFSETYCVWMTMSYFNVVPAGKGRYDELVSLDHVMTAV